MPLRTKIMINGQEVDYERFCELRKDMDMQKEYDCQVTDAIRLIISWDSKYRSSRRVKQPRRMTMILKYAYIAYLIEDEGFTYREVMHRLNELGLKTARNKTWKMKALISFYKRLRATEDIPEDFNPIEWEKDMRAAQERRDKNSVEKWKEVVKEKLQENDKISANALE